MARTSVDMENHTCDDRKCGRTQAATAGDNHAPEGWITGTVAQADANGALPVEVERVVWEACRLTHVKGAVEACLEREGVADDIPEPEPDPETNGAATRDVTAITARA